MELCTKTLPMGVSKLNYQKVIIFYYCTSYGYVTVVFSCFKFQNLLSQYTSVKKKIRKNNKIIKIIVN